MVSYGSQSTIISSLKCVKCQIFGTFDTPKHKNRSSSEMLNVLKLQNMLQYALIFESVRMKMLFLFIGFLFIVLSPLSSFCIFLFSLRHSLSLPFQSSLLKISLIFAQDLLPPHLAVNLHSPHRRPPQPLPPTFRSLNRVVGVIFGMGFDVWVLGH